VEHWKKLVQPIVKRQIQVWAESGEHLSLFRATSTVNLTVLFHIVTGSEFAEKHVPELVPLYLRYESAMETAPAIAFSRWVSPAGRFLNSFEARFKALIGEEIARRFDNWDNYKDVVDYLQILLSTGGKQFSEGIVCP
jgi:hypothetical protein